jgi:hypothetical protein
MLIFSAIWIEGPSRKPVYNNIVSCDVLYELSNLYCTERNENRRESGRGRRADEDTAIAPNVGEAGDNESISDYGEFICSSDTCEDSAGLGQNVFFVIVEARPSVG